MEKASLKKLLIAYLIDFILLAIVSNLFWLVMGPVCWKIVGFSPVFTWLVYIVSPVICIAYFAVCEYKGGKTLGKKIAGIQTVPSNGGNLSFGHVLGAYAVDIVLLAVFMNLLWWVTAPLSKQLIQSCADLRTCVLMNGLISSCISVAIHMMYFVIPEHVTGKALGKKLLGLQVVPNKK